MKYLKKFSTHSEYETYINGSGAILPNVSICTTEGDVHYNPTVAVTGVSLNKSELSLNKGDSEILIATVLPSNASNKSVTWSSSDDSVFTVSNNGLVTAVGDSGNANVIATTVDGGFTAQCVANITHDYSQDYFTMVVTSGGDIKFSGSTTANTLSYSKDNGANWSSVTIADTISVVEGDKVLWKGTPTPQPSKGIGKFIGGTDVRYSVEGNAMSLLFGDDFKDQISLSGKNYALYGLFRGNTNVTSAENLSLLATTSTTSCYSYMFRSCTSLTTAPELPATMLANECYNGMFYDCTNLTTAPSVLPATTLANNCYTQMFCGCTSLRTAPELPATTLANNCYSFMFNGCTSLTTAPELPATMLANECYQNMFQDCTSLTTAPELPATTLVISCYSFMFSGCTSLSSIKCLATSISARNCTYDWVNGVAASGTFTKAASMRSWTKGISGIPTNWTVKNA
jgi:hypothetical protein